MFTQKKIAHFLSLIIPVYKQEKTIVKDVTQIKRVLDSIRYDHEIIVVFDGASDQSYKKVKQANIPKVKTISYLKNQGKSHAIQLGMKKAIGDYVMFVDSGMEIDPNSISMLLEHMEWYNADIIVGSKRHPASQVNYVASRKLLSEGYYFVVKFLFGIKVRDTQAGIKIFKKKVLEKYCQEWLEKNLLEIWKCLSSPILWVSKESLKHLLNLIIHSALFLQRLQSSQYLT